jgi:hypothetical protein
MRAFRYLVFLATLFVVANLPIRGHSQCDLKTDVDAYITKEFYGGNEDFVVISNKKLHRVKLKWDLKGKQWTNQVWRSYIHFPEDQLPECVQTAFLRLRFQRVHPSGVWITVYAVDWDGTAFTWDNQPPGDLVARVQVFSTGWQEIDVTDVVQETTEGLRTNLAFMIRLDDENPPGSGSGRREASFDKPCLRIESCQLDVQVQGLQDSTVTQDFLGGNRYAPLGELQVTVSASVPYEPRICYEVTPAPVPEFSTDPVELSYNQQWITVPRCPNYTLLPGFSGTPGNEAQTYPVRVDLADLGDRKASESFTFVLHVVAVPQ